MQQMTLISGVERRRRWSEKQKQAILIEAFGSGGSVAEVARRHDLSTGLIYTWRRKLMGEPRSVRFVEAVVSEVEGAQPSGHQASSAVIIVELPGGGRVSLAASAPSSLAHAVLRALR